jgi:cell division protein FtsL
MTNSSKPLISKFLILLFVLTAIVLSNVGLRFKNEELLRLKSELLKTKADQRTLKVKLTAEYQEYSSEHRIIALAKSKLGMQRQFLPSVIISVDKNFINEVNEEINSKYE